MKKYFLFLIPLILLTIYFLYPIPEATINSLFQSINKKEDNRKIIVEYEEQKLLYEKISPEEAKEQWLEKCIKDCLEIEPYSSVSSFSPNEICNLRCQSRLMIGEGSVYFKISAERINELKNISFNKLFFENFNGNINKLYQNLIKSFNFQKIIIVILGLILYYGIIFGFLIIKRLKK